MAGLRFVAALAVGYVLLLISSVTLRSAGFERFHGIIFIGGLILIVAAAIRFAVPGHVSTVDRAAGTAAAGSLRVRSVTVVLAVLRFLAMLAVGCFLLFVLHVTLLFAGVERFNGIIIAAGLVLTVAAAMRIAVQGRLNMFDRAAGTAAAGIFALTLAGLALAVLGGLALLAIVWLPLRFAGAGPGSFDAVKALFERAATFVVLTQFGIMASLAATWLLWRRRHGQPDPRT
jgi:hypothetical protein